MTVHKQKNTGLLPKHRVASRFSEASLGHVPPPKTEFLTGCNATAASGLEHSILIISSLHCSRIAMFPSHQVNATTMAMLPFALGAPASASAPTASDPIRLPLLPMNMAANSHSTGFQSAQVANHSSLGLINSPSEATMLAAANQQLKERLARLQDLVKADEARRLLYDFAARSTINREEPAVLQASNQQAEAPCPFAARSLSKVRTVASERSAIALPEEVKSPKEASQVLNILGTTIRSKSDRFVDASRLPYTKLPPSIRGGICQFFPDKIYKLLEEAEEQGNTDIISFLPHGRAFKVHKLEAFVEGLLPLFFNGQTKWASFSRQLNLCTSLDSRLVMLVCYDAPLTLFHL